MTLFASRAVRIFTLLIALGFGLFGLVRLVVGAIMIGQATGQWDLGGEMAQGVVDVEAFLAQHNGDALIAMDPVGYFAIIAAMGVTLIVGAGLYLAKWHRAGLVWLGAYLAMHAGLFINFGVINPKLWILAATIAAWGWLWWRRAPRTP